MLTLPKLKKKELADKMKLHMLCYLRAAQTEADSR